MVEERRILRAVLADQLKQLAESQFLDVKSKQIAPGKLSRSISAFCNADGGVLIIGIEETSSGREWNGFENQEAANGIFQLIHEIFPLGNSVTPAFYSAPGEKGILLILEMTKTAEIIKASDGKVYLRRGASNQPVTTSEQIKQLELTKGVASHEDATVKDDLSSIMDSKVFTRFMEAIVPSADKATWLKKTASSC